MGAGVGSASYQQESLHRRKELRSVAPSQISRGNLGSEKSVDGGKVAVPTFCLWGGGGGGQ